MSGYDGSDSRYTITVAARVSFATVDHIGERLAGADFPIELALPHRYEWWREAADRMDEMMACLESLGLTVATVHAVQARISDGDFLVWGKQTIRIAEHLGARAITVHPNGHNKDRGNHQFMALQYLRTLQRETDVCLTVETFGGKDRVLRPEELVDADVPMTLDVAHIGDNDRILTIIDRHWRHIPVVHLSARASNYWRQRFDAPLSDEGRSEHHLPLDPFCIQVVRKLVAFGWSGTIVLEYMPHYHYRLRPDLKIVGQALQRDIDDDELPSPCDVYRGMPEMYGHNAPPPDETTA